MFADPAGELLDRPIIAVGDHRGDIHRCIPFHFDVKGELLPAVLCCQKFSSATSFEFSENSRMATLTSGFQTSMEELIRTRCHKVLKNRTKVQGD